MSTRIDIINRALLRLGQDPLQSEAADSADTHITVYDSVLEAILSLYPWSFARHTWRLARQTAAPAQHYKFAFDLPSELLGAPRAVFNQPDRRIPFTNWRLASRQLLTDADQIWLEGMQKPDPLYWPGYFRELITMALMAEFALSIREDRTLRNELRGDVYGDGRMAGEGGLLAQAKALDAQGQPSAVVAEGSCPLIDVRW